MTSSAYQALLTHYFVPIEKQKNFFYLPAINSPINTNMRWNPKPYLFAYWNYLQLHKPDYTKCLENSD